MAIMGTKVRPSKSYLGYNLFKLLLCLLFFRNFYHDHFFWEIWKLQKYFERVGTVGMGKCYLYIFEEHWTGVFWEWKISVLKHFKHQVNFSHISFFREMWQFDKCFERVREICYSSPLQQHLSPLLPVVRVEMGEEFLLEIFSFQLHPPDQPV